MGLAIASLTTNRKIGTGYWKLIWGQLNQFFHNFVFNHGYSSPLNKIVRHLLGFFK
jgi:hypothetical protein